MEYDYHEPFFSHDYIPEEYEHYDDHDHFESGGGGSDFPLLKSINLEKDSKQSQENEPPSPYLNYPPPGRTRVRRDTLDHSQTIKYYTFVSNDSSDGFPTPKHKYPTEDDLRLSLDDDIKHYPFEKEMDPLFQTHRHHHRKNRQRSTRSSGHTIAKLLSGLIRISFRDVTMKSEYTVKGSAGGVFTFKESGDLDLVAPTVFLTSKLNITMLMDTSTRHAKGRK